MDITNVPTLKTFAENEIKRLNHWYVWNGRAKAEAIQNALNTMGEVFKDNEQEVQHSPVAIARESGLLQALSTHRHGFFSHAGKARSHQSLSDRCLNIDVKI